MKGIRFISNDDSGKKVAVRIDLKTHGRLWEDFYDSLVARSRIYESRESLVSVKQSLIKHGKLSG
jgi:hypothetical protein